MDTPLPLKLLGKEWYEIDLNIIHEVCHLLADGIELLDSRQYTMRIVLNVIHTT